MGMFGIFLGLALGLIALGAKTGNTPNANVGSTISSAADNLLGLDSQSGQTQFRTAMENNNQQSEVDRQFQYQMFQETNEWNSPAHQMQLLRDAGLNPSMMYGQPVDATATAPAGAEASIGTGSAGSLSQLLGLGADAAMLPAQVDLMRAQADEIRSRIPLNQQRTSNLKAQYEDILASVKQRLADIGLKVSQTNLNDEQRNNISFEQMLKNNQLQIDYQRLANENAITAANVENIKSNTRLTLARAGVTEREYQEMLWTYAIRKAGLEKQNILTDAKIREADATAARLAKEGVRIEQILDIDSPEQINSKGWSEALLGQRGKVEQVGADLLYNFLSILKQIGVVIK